MSEQFRIERTSSGNGRSHRRLLRRADPAGDRELPINGIPDPPGPHRAMAIVKKAAALATATRGTWTPDRRRHLGGGRRGDRREFHDQFLVDRSREARGRRSHEHERGAGQPGAGDPGRPQGDVQGHQPEHPREHGAVHQRRLPHRGPHRHLDLLKEMLGELRNLRDAFAAKEKEYEGIIKMGRTTSRTRCPSAWPGVRGLSPGP